jgi:hypothetical protein
MIPPNLNRIVHNFLIDGLEIEMHSSDAFFSVFGTYHKKTVDISSVISFFHEKGGMSCYCVPSSDHCKQLEISVELVDDWISFLSK